MIEKIGEKDRFFTVIHYELCTLKENSLYHIYNYLDYIKNFFLV